MAKIGLVTVLYNSDDVLEGFFKSLSAQEFKDYHLYLIDNSVSATTDALIDDFVLKYPVTGYTHVRNPENAGVAKGNNQGIELALQANSEYMLLLNNDIEFYQPNLISAMLDCAAKGEHLIVPKILYFGTRVIWMAGGKLLKAKGYTIHIGEDEPDSLKYSTNEHFDYAPTCFMLINKLVFNEVGMMDENYFVYYDDTDFVYRAVKKGYKVYFMNDLEVFHKVSSSTGGNETLFSIYYTHRNRIYFVRKNFTGLQRIAALVYISFSRALKFGLYSKEQRKKLISGFKDGFKLSW